jgi:hypothetical protein
VLALAFFISVRVSKTLFRQLLSMTPKTAGLGDAVRALRVSPHN